jgi:hypothetical protein
MVEKDLFVILINLLIQLMDVKIVMPHVELVLLLEKINVLLVLIKF